MVTAESFGRWLKVCRKERDLTQGELARRVYCSAVTVRKIEAGTLRPSRQVAERLAEALELPLADRADFVAFARGVRPPATSLPPRGAAAHATPPVPLTPLLGRDEEVCDVARRLREGETRLLTLTGMGGAGKTRLALEVAAALTDAFEDGVVFVSLAPVRDANLVIPTIAAALDVRETAGTSFHEALRERLHGMRALLVLDNCEHVTSAAPDVVDVALRWPGVAILATSRAALRVRGEHVVSVAPLAVPAADSSPTVAALSAYPAVALFVQRARSVCPDFQLDADNAADVAEICRRLDGLPLAIELAAARLKVLPAQAMVARIADRFGMLTGGAQDLPPRQRSLRATIDWSYELLTASERRLLAVLSTFADGCTLDMVVRVCTQAGVLEGEGAVLDGLGGLIDKSLLWRETGNLAERGGAGEPRFMMFETIREYGGKRLEAHEMRALIRQAYAASYLDVAEEAEEASGGTMQRAWLDRLNREHDNMRAALAWCHDSGEGETLLRMGGALAWFWQTRGYLSEGRRWLRTATADNRGIAPRVRAKALRGAAILAAAQSDDGQTTVAATQSLEISGAMGDEYGVAEALRILGDVARREDDYDRARELYENSLTRYRALPRPRGAAQALDSLGVVAWMRGDLDRARALYEESLLLLRAQGDGKGMADVLNHLGIVLAESGNHAEGRALCEEGLALRRELGDKAGLALSLCNLGVIAEWMGDKPRAATLLEEGIAALRAVGNRHQAAGLMHNLGVIRRKQGDYDGALAAIREALAAQLNLGGKDAIAAGFDDVALIALARGYPRRATALLAAAATIRAAVGAAPAATDQDEVGRHIVILRAHLGRHAFAEAWAEGQGMTTEQAVAYALTDEPPTYDLA